VDHEPPVRQLLPEGEREAGDVRETYRRDGAAEAWRMFAARIGVPESAGALAKQGGRFAVNAEFFFGQYHLCTRPRR
jgi:hypothetical protein